MKLSFTVKRITGLGFVGWVALQQNKLGVLHVLALVNHWQPIATDVSQFPPPFCCYLPWNERKEVTFDSEFNGG